MKSKIITVHQADGRKIPVDCYLSASDKLGSLLILHGMAEHHNRYNAFATFLSNHGYDVYLYDHRGHGTHLPINELGFLAEKDGYQLLVNDAIDILKFIQNQDTSLPLYLMGHSMGSIVTRNVIQKYDNLKGVIICGTANPAPLTTLGGLMVSKLSGYKRKPHKPDPFINNLMFGSGLYKKLNKRTSNDWLSTDEAEVDKYTKDPYCGFVCTKSFYHDLLQLTKKATDKNLMLKTNKAVPLFIISGGMDPVGGFGKDVKRLVDFYESNGYHVTSKLYPGLRHEILNETKRQEVMNDILNFLTSLSK